MATIRNFPIQKRYHVVLKIEIDVSVNNTAKEICFYLRHQVIFVRLHSCVTARKKGNWF
jgi:hypothetical protein